jgi:hypothetical protein
MPDKSHHPDKKENPPPPPKQPPDKERPKPANPGEAHGSYDKKKKP